MLVLKPSKRSGQSLRNRRNFIPDELGSSPKKNWPSGPAQCRNISPMDSIWTPWTVREFFSLEWSWSEHHSISPNLTYFCTDVWRTTWKIPDISAVSFSWRTSLFYTDFSRWSQEFFGAFHGHGGCPSSLDGFCEGKSLSKMDDD